MKLQDRIDLDSGGRLRIAAVYAIENIDAPEGEVRKYVGASRDVVRRWRQYVARLQKGNHPCADLQAAVNRYGLAAFKLIVLEEVNVEALTRRQTLEKLWVHKQRWLDEIGIEELYNLLPRADSRLGVKHTAATVAKLRVHGQAAYAKGDGIAALTTDQLRDAGLKGHAIALAAMTPERRSENARQAGFANRGTKHGRTHYDAGLGKATFEQLSEYGRKGAAAVQALRSPQRRSQIARQAAIALRDATTPEQRRASAAKMPLQTRRANGRRVGTGGRGLHVRWHVNAGKPCNCDGAQDKRLKNRASF
jgi:group I intron endonuclease